MPISPEERQNNRIRFATDNGQSSRNWRDNVKKVHVKHELEAVEQLADRITIQCSALRRLSEVIPGYQDRDALRAIGLAIGSMTKALDAIDKTVAEIDEQEFGGSQAVAAYVPIEYGVGLDGLEDAANDIGIQANSQAYMGSLIKSRRRPSPYALQAMRSMVEAMTSALAGLGG